MDSILEALSSTEILALTIIGEGRGEPIQGQVAIGCVIRNRLARSPAKYKNLGDVCLENKQFSCWNEDDPNRVFLLEIANKMMSGQPLSDAYLKQCVYVAVGIADWSIMDNTAGAVNYLTFNLFNSDRRPKWASNPIHDPITHGKQVFFSV